MSAPLQTAAKLLSAEDPGRQRILVLVTDGQVAGEDAVLRSLKKSVGSTVPRIYTLGIDRAGNVGFLRRLSGLGGGSCDLVESEDRLDEAMDHIHRAIGSPALTELQLEPIGGTWDADSLAPSRFPDLFADRPVTIFGRCGGGVSSLRIRLRAVDASGTPWEHEVTARTGPADALQSLWGRAKVRELEDRYAAGDTRDPKGLEKQIVDVSLSTSVLSRFTAYVAVDRSEVVNQGGRQEQVVQPVETPDGWGMSADSLLAEDTSIEACLASPAPEAAWSARGAMPVASLFKMKKRSFRAGAARSPRPTREFGRLEDVVAEIRRLLEKLDEHRRLWLKRRRATVEQLAKLLGELAVLLRREQNATADAAAEAVEQVAQDAGDLLDDYKHGNKKALDPEHVNRLVAIARDALDKVEQRPSSEVERERFWT
jgi:Ca-activated chloride channel family protein